MTTQFRLLDLPILAISDVFSKFTYHELIDISLCSLKCKKIVKSTRTSKISIDIQIDKFDRSIYLKSIDDKKICFIIHFKRHSGGKIEKETRIIDGKQWKFRRYSHILIEIFSPYKPEKKMEKIIELFMEIFNISKIGVDFFLKGMKEQEIEGVFQSIIFNSKIREKCSSISIHSPLRLRNEIYQNLLVNYSKISEKLSITDSVSYPPSDFQTNEIIEFSTQHLNIRNSRWMPRGTLFSFLNCGTVEIGTCLFSTEDLMEFIEKWLKSNENYPIECLKIRQKAKKFCQLNLEIFEAKSWDPNMRNRFYSNPNLKSEIDCSEGMDIIRSDGLLATVIDTRQSFQFVVWHQRL